jgi:ABC-2 type transport system permease protein
MSTLAAVRLIARREIVVRVRERSFLVSTGLSAVIVLLVVGLGSLVGGSNAVDIGVSDPAALPIAQAAARAAEGGDQTVRIHAVAPADVRAQLEDGTLDVDLDGHGIRSKDQPDDSVQAVLQAAARQIAAVRTLRDAGVDDATVRRALDPPPLQVTTIEPVDPQSDALAAFAFLAVILLYGQLLTYGYWVAAGVVEEKASRVVEVVLSAVRPRQLLAGKVIGLGVLALGHLLVIAVIGLVAAAATGAIDVDAARIGAAALVLAWFVAGYAFYSCAFACAGALVPRQEELQSTTMPLTLLILVSFFVSFAVSADPDGTLAHVTAFIPTTAPITMPGRIITGDAPAWEVVASFAVTLAAAAALIPLAARIYEGGVLRTGSAVRLREAWRAARA